MEGIYVRFEFNDVDGIGPFRAALLEAIDEFASIAGAARALEVGYATAWNTVGVMNRTFSQPLVVTKRGGLKTGGASLTPTGRQVVSLFRAAERDIYRAVRTHAEALDGLLSPARFPGRVHDASRNGTTVALRKKSALIGALLTASRTD